MVLTGSAAGLEPAIGAFQVVARDPGSSARRARLRLAHGVVETPVFMPVGTHATVKGLTPPQLEDTGAQIVLANTYHLALRPGDERIARLGGLHAFMGWRRPILTDSGGFQVFSLSDLRDIDDQRVRFQSPIDGQWLELSPERAVAIQENLGADIIMCLDECPPADATRDALAKAVERTTRWAERCVGAKRRADQLLFGIVQGGADAELRASSAGDLRALDFPGYAIGGVSVGEPPEVMRATLALAAPLLPEEKPRYLMGVGRPQDLLHAVGHGIDMFDCVMPTRNGRNATAFTHQGVVKLRNARHADDPAPLDERCSCLACRQFSRAYLRHLFQADEMLGPILVSLHNIAFYCQLMAAAREAIDAGRFAAFAANALADMDAEI